MSKVVTAITMPMAMIEQLDHWLDTKHAAQMGLSSRPDVMKMLLREFLKVEEKLIREPPKAKNVKDLTI